jgi:hypothetical protein
VRHVDRIGDRRAPLIGHELAELADRQVSAAHVDAGVDALRLVVGLQLGRRRLRRGRQREGKQQRQRAHA